MKKTPPPCPTSDECNKTAPFEWPGGKGFAAWYPQMGGYAGRCVVDLSHRGTTTTWRDGERVEMPGRCFDVYVWMGDDVNPILLHHCNPRQFVEFGQLVGAGMLGEALAGDEIGLSREEEVAMLKYLAWKYPDVVAELEKRSRQ